LHNLLAAGARNSGDLQNILLNDQNVRPKNGKSKAAIAVRSLDKLPSVIDTLITAVRNGELDEQLGQSSKVGIVKRWRH
jgi:hypothetical protein